VKLRSRDSLELAICYALIVAVIWIPHPAQRLLFWITFAWILATTLVKRVGLESLGLRPSGARCWILTVGVGFLVGGIFVFLARGFHTLHALHGAGPPVFHVVGYFLWAFEQQFILQDYFLFRLLRILPGEPVAVIATATLFSAAHLPGLLLTTASFLWGLASCSLFLRCRNLYALGIAHGILGLAVAISAPDALTHHMMVGLGYLRYHPH
jgi:hypothetical protein